MPWIKRKDQQLKNEMKYNSVSRKEVNGAHCIIKMKGDNNLDSSGN